MDQDDFTIITVTGSRKDGKEPLDDGNEPKPGEDRRMMLSPQYWPVWPVLPIKNNKKSEPGGFPRIGILYDREGDEERKGPPRFGFLEKLMSEVGEDDLKASPEADIDQLLADGWVVD